MASGGDARRRGGGTRWIWRTGLSFLFFFAVVSASRLIVLPELFAPVFGNARFEAYRVWRPDGARRPSSPSTSPGTRAVPISPRGFGALFS